MPQLTAPRKLIAAAAAVLALGGIGAGVATAATLSTGSAGSSHHVSTQVDTPEPGDTPDQPGAVGQNDQSGPGDHADHQGQADTPEPGDTPDQPGVANN